MKVLYHGPRRFVALSETMIGENKATALVMVRITFIFNKVKKYVILLKDIKRLDERKFSGRFRVVFSNRGEWER